MNYIHIPSIVFPQDNKITTSSQVASNQGLPALQDAKAGGTTHVSLTDARLTLFTMTYRSTNQTVQWMRNIYNVYKTTTFCAEKL